MYLPFSNLNDASCIIEKGENKSLYKKTAAYISELIEQRARPGTRQTSVLTSVILGWET